MVQWFADLGSAARFFWIVAITASLFQVLLFVGSLFIGHEFDHSHDGSAAEGVKVLSVRVVVAFLVGFGWTGALLLGDGGSLMQVSSLAILAGLVFMAVIYGIMRLLVSLRADGTLDYSNAVGESGHVYVTIPANRAGEGQIEILFQGRLVTASAVTDGLTALAPRTQVKVEAVQGHTTLVVAASH